MNRNCALLGLLIVSTLPGILLLLPAPAAPSEEDEKRPKLQIINGGTHPIEVFWLKAEDERVSNGVVAPGDYAMISTTIGIALLW